MGCRFGFLFRVGGTLNESAKAPSTHHVLYASSPLLSALPCQPRSPRRRIAYCSSPRSRTAPAVSSPTSEPGCVLASASFRPPCRPSPVTPCIAPRARSQRTASRRTPVHGPAQGSPTHRPAVAPAQSGRAPCAGLSIRRGSRIARCMYPPLHFAWGCGRTGPVRVQSEEGGKYACGDGNVVQVSSANFIYLERACGDSGHGAGVDVPRAASWRRARRARGV